MGTISIDFLHLDKYIFKIMARPHLENAAPIWSPDHTKYVTFLCIYAVCVGVCVCVGICMYVRVCKWVHVGLCTCDFCMGSLV